MAIHIDVLSRLDESSAEEVSRQLERHMENAGERAATALGNAMKRRLEQANVSDAMMAEFEKMEKRAALAGEAIGAALVGGITAAAVGLVEVGEKFEAIHRGLETTTAASGQALDDLKTHADALVGTLDVAAGNVGNLMGQISSQMGMGAGPALDQLTGHIAELADRFKGLSTDALIGGLVQMRVPAQQADEVIASLVGSAREFGGVLPQIAQGLAQYGAYFTDLKLNAEQAGHMIGELAKAHIPLQTAMSGLQAAQKANIDVAKNTGQPVEEFSTFVARAAKTMEEANKSGNDALRDQIALLVFGQRKWIDAKAAADTYLETLRAGPEAFRGSIEKEDKFLEATRNLHNEFERLKNQIALALEPVAHEWVDELVDKLHEFGEWAKAHQEDLRNLFEGAAEIAGGVITVLEKIAELLGEHPGLIYAVAAAFTTWEAISGVMTLIRDLSIIKIALLGMPAEAEAAGAGVAAGLAPAIAAAAELGTVLATALAVKETIDQFNPAAGDPNKQIPPDQRSWWDTIKTWMSPGEAAVTDPNDPRNPHYKPPVPFFGPHGEPLNAQGQPFTGSQPFGAEPMGPRSYAPGWQAGPGGAPVPAPPQPPPGMVVDPETGALLTPEDFEKAKQGRKGKLPEAPEVPYGPGYGAPPEFGESEQHYRNRMNLLEKQHELATDQARLDQLEKTNTATADEIQKAKNKVVHDQVELNQAQMAADKAETERLHKHSQELEQIGAKIDEDFGISKGLPGIAENLTKFLFNLAFAPAEGAMAGAAAALAPEGTYGAKGLIGAAALGGAFGQRFTPAGIEAARAEGGAGGGGGFGIPSLDFGNPRTPAEFGAAGARIQSLYAFANSMVGTPYSTALRNDCSGAVSRLVNVALGLPPAVSFDTTSEGAYLQAHGFQAGIGPPGSLQVGWNPAPGMAGHTAATLPGGVHAEQGGANSAFTLGPGAAGGESRQFPMHAYLPMAAYGQGPQGLSPEAAIRAGIVPQHPGMSMPVGYDQGGAVPIMAHAGEHVFTADDVAAMGGQGAVYSFRAGLHYQGGGPVYPQAPAPPPPPPPPPAPRGPTPEESASAFPPYQNPPQRQLPHIAVPPGWKGADEPPTPPGAPGAGPAPLGAPGPPGAAPAPGQPTGGPQPGPSTVGGGEPLALPGPGIGFGGGLIGLAESAPGMAASTMGAPFGGAAAAAAIQIGMQELNRAIGFAGQAAGIGVEGLMETFLPAGASKLASDNWITRIAAGVSGAKPQLPNVAGQKQGSQDLARGLTPEQLASQGIPDTGQGGAPGPGGPNQAAAPLVYIHENHMIDSPDQNAAALQRGLTAGYNANAVLGGR